METKEKKVLLFGADEKIAGVVAGIANYYNKDIKKARILYATATLLTGMIPGLLAYIIIAFKMCINEEHNGNSAIIGAK